MHNAVASSSAANAQVSLGPAAIPSRRSRNVPGLQPGVMPIGKTPTAAASPAPGSGEMPRYCSNLCNSQAYRK